MRDSNGKYYEVTLHNVVYHPLLSNLMSVRRLWRDNHIAARFGDHNILKCKHSGAKFNFEYATSYSFAFEPGWILATLANTGQPPNRAPSAESGGVLPRGNTCG